MWWLWLLYAISLVLIVYVSNKLAEYVDALDKKTKLTGAFLGGVLLSAITSLPELITSLTSALMGQPEMTLGNILGSNGFDLTIIGVLMLIFAKKVKSKKISKGNIAICVATFAVATVIMLCSIFDIKVIIPYLNINILTPLILMIYFVALFFTQGEHDSIKKDKIVPKVEKKENAVLISDRNISQEKNSAQALSVKKIIINFSICAVVLIGLSVAMTFMVDKIAVEYNLGKGIAGALFLGIATSLPEIVSTFSLVRLGNFDAGYGGIIGSCLFNFAVIAVVDIFYFAGTVFVADMQSTILSACLTGACAILLAFSLYRNSKSKFKHSLVVQTITGVLITACYITFLVLSTVL